MFSFVSLNYLFLVVCEYGKRSGSRGSNGTVDNTNTEFNVRYRLIKQIKQLELFGKINADIFNVLTLFRDFFVLLYIYTVSLYLLINLIYDHIKRTDCKGLEFSYTTWKFMAVTNCLFNDWNCHSFILCAIVKNKLRIETWKKLSCSTNSGPMYLAQTHGKFCYELRSISRNCDFVATRRTGPWFISKLGFVDFSLKLFRQLITKANFVTCWL